MIQIVDKSKCCGCEACVNRCPKRSITMQEDSEGFYYPVVDIISCINCGLCDKICPMNVSSDIINPIEVYAAKNKCDDERMQSSSGGIFYALAKNVIGNGGVVFGALFSSDWKRVNIGYAETLEEVRPMMGSKYVQAVVGAAYKQAEVFLKQGRLVLFAGMPCHIAGLNSFLNKEYDNLLRLEILCHGAPSPGVWRSYLENDLTLKIATESGRKNSVLSSSINTTSSIESIAFRDKTQYGWKKFSFVVRGTSAVKADGNTVLLSDINNENPYMYGFMSNMYSRRSCYECKFKEGRSHSDIAIGDYWGINRINSTFDDDKGTSLVLLYSIKGVRWYRALELESYKSSYEEVLGTGNAGLKSHICNSHKRELFYQAFNKGLSVSVAVNHLRKETLLAKYIYFLENSIKGVIKILLPASVVHKLKKQYTTQR